MDDLWKIVQSIRIAADKSGVKIVTGDTKVVDRGKGDGIYINTSGIGEIIPGTNIGPGQCKEGDVIIINGTIADHGIAIVSKREGLMFESELQSDTVSLQRMMTAVLEKNKSVHVLRDPTRGGLSSALNEIAQASKTGITLFEDEIRINESVKGACEILGFDPLYIANEGKILVIIPEEDADEVLEIMRTFDEGRLILHDWKSHGGRPGTGETEDHPRQYPGGGYDFGGTITQNMLMTTIITQNRKCGRS